MVEQVELRGVQGLVPGVARADIIAYGAVLALGVLLFWLSGSYPSRMPVWAPWDFSVTVSQQLSRSYGSGAAWR